MSKEFDWQTKDDTTWDEEQRKQPASSHPQDSSWLRRHARWLGVTAVLLLIVALAIYIPLNRRVEQAEEETTADILAVHGLVRQAAFEKDYDLLSSLMVEDDLDWVDYQLELLNINLFLDRAPLRLKLDPQLATKQVQPGETLTVTLSPDLQSAQLIDRLPYTVTGAQQNPQIVWLEQTFHYRRQAESWLLTPLPDDEEFWGHWQNLEESDLLTVVYPRRDEEFALFLAPKMDDLINRLCQDETVGCPDDFHLELRLFREQDQLNKLNESVIDIFITSNRGAYHFSLPAPTLAGRPVDENGRESLYRGYAGWVASVIINRFSPPMLAINQIIEEKLTPFGLELPPRPAIVLPMPEPIPPPPIPFPEQDVLFACSDFNSIFLLRYNPRANRWIDEIGAADTTYLSSRSVQISGSLMTALPDDSGVLLSINDTASTENKDKIILWRDRQEQLWLESETMLQLLQESIQQQFDPSGRNIVIFDAPSTTGGFLGLPYALNIDDCLSGECQYTDYHGFPYWSPDLSWAVAVEPVEQGSLTLWNTGTGEEIMLGTGFSPVWVDDETFFYIRTEGDPNADFENAPNVQIVSAAISNPLSSTVVLESADIAAAVNEENLAEAVSIHQVVVHPEQRDWVFIFAAAHFSVSSHENYLLAYRRTTGELAALTLFGEKFLTTPLLFSPDGRYLTIPTFDSPPESSFAQTSLNLIPLEPDTMTIAGPTESYEDIGNLTYYWSQDGRWILIVNQDNIRLIAPGQNYDHTIPYSLGHYCTAAWINAAP